MLRCSVSRRRELGSVPNLRRRTLTAILGHQKQAGTSRRKWQVFRRRGSSACVLNPPQATTDEKREQSMISQVMGRIFPIRPCVSCGEVLSKAKSVTSKHGHCLALTSSCMHW